MNRFFWSVVMAGSCFLLGAFAETKRPKPRPVSHPVPVKPAPGMAGDFQRAWQNGKFEPALPVRDADRERIARNLAKVSRAIKS